MAEPTGNPLPPGARLVAALVAGIDAPTPADYDSLLDQVADWERIRSWAEAMQNDRLLELDRIAGIDACTEPDAEVRSVGLRSVPHQLAEDVAIALQIGSLAAHYRVQHAHTLHDRLPHTAAALHAGTITSHHARAAAAATRTCADDVARDVDTAAHAEDRWRTPRQLEHTAAKLVISLDPAGASARHRRAVEDRTVRFRTAEDGMSTLWALLPAADAQTLAAAIDARARAGLTHPDPAGAGTGTGTGKDVRTLAQRRADVLVAFGADALNAPDAPTVHHRRPRVCVTVSWSTLLGLDDHPADLTGYGPIDADTARRIAADPTSTWHRLLLDPCTGRLIDYGRTVYAPPPDLAAFVTTRDRTCRHPSCDHPAAGADLDHRIRWTDGGTTSAGNLDTLCRRHHRLKDEAGWTHARDPGTGDSIWTTPRKKRVVKAANQPPPAPDLGPPPF